MSEEKPWPVAPEGTNGTAYAHTPYPIVRRPAAVETTEAVLMCLTCNHPTRHRFERAQRVEIMAKVVRVEHVFSCDRCGASRIWGVSE